jgi:hypothetical protein
MIALTVSIALPIWAGENLISGDKNAFEPFTVRIEAGKAVEKTGNVPAPWSCAAWHGSTTAEVRLEAADVTRGENAFALVNLEGKNSVMPRIWRPVRRRAGRRFGLAFDYLTTGDAHGTFKPPGVDRDDAKQLGLQANYMRGFKGDYRMTAKVGERKNTTTATLGDGGSEVVLRLR